MITNVEINNNELIGTINGSVIKKKPFLLTVKSLEEKIASIHYTGTSRPRSDFVEKMNFPPMSLAFYSFLFQTGTIPTEEEFLSTYEYLYSAHITFSDGKTKMYIDNIPIFWPEYYRGRLLRTYPSFIREIHFLCVLRECGLFSNVRYSFEFDLIHNTDIIIDYNGKTYYLWLTLDTDKAKWGLKRKLQKLQYAPAVIIKMNLSRAPLCGDFKLFSLNTLKDLQICLDNNNADSCSYIDFIEKR